MLPAHVWVYIADIFLIHNCILIKREWKDNPPDFVKKQQAEIEYKKVMQVDSKNMNQYKMLIEKCGIKFFIKYYEQIKRLPLRDIVVSENYSPTEREERLFAAKKIIDLNLAKFTLNEILKSYSDILAENEIKKAKSILENESAEQTLQKEKQCIKQEEYKTKRNKKQEIIKPDEFLHIEPNCLVCKYYINEKSCEMWIKKPTEICEEFKIKKYLYNKEK